MDLSVIARMLKPSAGAGVRFVQGVVVSGPANGVVTVTLAGDDTQIPGVRYLSGCCPQSGQTVWLASDGADLFVVGALAPAPSAPQFTPAYVWSGSQASNSGFITNQTIDLLSFSYTAPTACLLVIQGNLDLLDDTGGGGAATFWADAIAKIGGAEVFRTSGTSGGNSNYQHLSLPILAFASVTAGTTVSGVISVQVSVGRCKAYAAGTRGLAFAIPQ